MVLEALHQHIALGRERPRMLTGLSPELVASCRPAFAGEGIPGVRLNSNLRIR